MKNLILVNIDRIDSSELKKDSKFSHYEVRGLNKFLKRIEKKLNKQIKKQIKTDEDLETVKTVTATKIKTYPFRISNKEVEEKFYENLSKEYVEFIDVYYYDLSFTAIFFNFLSKSGGHAEEMCDVEVDVEKLKEKSMKNHFFNL